MFTTKDAREVIRSHVNLVVSERPPGSSRWCTIPDSHKAVRALVKNHGLNFAIPYFHDDQHREYVPDYVVRLNVPDERYVIAELKGEDWKKTADIKAQAARRWCAAVNATGELGTWDYKLAFSVPELVQRLNGVSPK